VNPLQDVDADAKKVVNAFTTRTAVAADDGVDFEDICKQLAEEKRIAERYGLTLTSTEGPPAASTQPPPTNDTESTDDQEKKF
jgi:capsid protein